MFEARNEQQNNPARERDNKYKYFLALMVMIILTLTSYNSSFVLYDRLDDMVRTEISHFLAFKVITLFLTSINVFIFQPSVHEHISWTSINHEFESFTFFPNALKVNLRLALNKISNISHEPI